MITTLAILRRIWPYLVVLAVFFGYGHWRYNAGAASVQNKWDLSNAKKSKEVAIADSHVVVDQQNNTQQAVNESAQADIHQQQVRVVYRTITKAVKEYVQSNPSVSSCGLDVDGVRIWNSANAGTNDTSKASNHEQSVGIVPGVTSSK